MSTVRRELEFLTGKLIQGDITPIVYELLKDSCYKEDILMYESFLVKEHEISKRETMKEEGREDFDTWIKRVGILLEEE